MSNWYWNGICLRNGLAPESRQATSRTNDGNENNKDHDNKDWISIVKIVLTIVMHAHGTSQQTTWEEKKWREKGGRSENFSLIARFMRHRL